MVEEVVADMSLAHATVIRIFGVYTHAEIDQRFWDAMSRQLNGRGAEYRKRCDHTCMPMFY